MRERPGIATMPGRIDMAAEGPQRPGKNAVGVYDRPHPLRTRRVLVPSAIFVVVAIGSALWFYLR